MKVITVQQPYATLLVAGLKEYETRSWSTKHRGTIAIHAGKNPKTLHQVLKHLRERTPEHRSELSCAVLSAIQDKPELFAGDLEQYFPCGFVLGTVDLVDIVPSYPPNLTNREHALGEHGAGRVAWKMTNPVRYATPFPASGKLGIWEL